MSHQAGQAQDGMQDTAPERAHYGAWPTLGLSGLVLMGIFVIHLFTGELLYLFGAEVGQSRNAEMAVYWVAAFAGMGLLARIISHHPEMGFRQYLGLHAPRPKALWAWLGLTGLFYAIFVLAPALALVAQGASWGPLAGTVFFVITAVTIAPLFEETLFRGFLLPGLARSRLGPAPAIMLVSALWVAVHFRLSADVVGEVYGLVILFGLGLLLGLARLREGSLVVPIAMHALWNGTVLGVDSIIIARAGSAL
ncbi:MAG: type II CAAX endopeptidase family protein [Alphaproteobacteria bacterium]|nr:type II CAAX endopeptidase family protein [Alphaproteobacteria bacterium]